MSFSRVKFGSACDRIITACPSCRSNGPFSATSEIVALQLIATCSSAVLGSAIRGERKRRRRAGRRRQPAAQRHAGGGARSAAAPATYPTLLLALSNL